MIALMENHPAQPLIFQYQYTGSSVEKPNANIRYLLMAVGNSTALIGKEGTHLGELKDSQTSDWKDVLRAAISKSLVLEIGEALRAQNATDEHAVGDLREATRPPGIWSSTNMDDVIEAVRSLLTEDVAVRLEELDAMPYDPNDGEEPLEYRSVQWFADYCLKKGISKRPIMTVTRSGHLQADWSRGPNKHLAIRFAPDGMVWVAINEARVRGSLEMRASDLLGDQSPFRIPEWA